MKRPYLRLFFVPVVLYLCSSVCISPPASVAGTVCPQKSVAGWISSGSSFSGLGGVILPLRRCLELESAAAAACSSGSAAVSPQWMKLDVRDDYQESLRIEIECELVVDGPGVVRVPLCRFSGAAFVVVASEDARGAVPASLDRSGTLSALVAGRGTHRFKLVLDSCGPDGNDTCLAGFSFRLPSSVGAAVLRFLSNRPCCRMLLAPGLAVRHTAPVGSCSGIDGESHRPEGVDGSSPGEGCILETPVAGGETIDLVWQRRSLATIERSNALFELEAFGGRALFSFTPRAGSGGRLLLKIPAEFSGKSLVVKGGRLIAKKERVQDVFGAAGRDTTGNLESGGLDGDLSGDCFRRLLSPAGAVPDRYARGWKGCFAVFELDGNSRSLTLETRLDGLPWRVRGKGIELALPLISAPFTGAELVFRCQGGLELLDALSWTAGCHRRPSRMIRVSARDGASPDETKPAGFQGAASEATGEAGGDIVRIRAGSGTDLLDLRFLDRKAAGCRRSLSVLDLTVDCVLSETGALAARLSFLVDNTTSPWLELAGLDDPSVVLAAFSDGKRVEPFLSPHASAMRVPLTFFSPSDGAARGRVDLYLRCRPLRSGGAPSFRIYGCERLPEGVGGGGGLLGMIPLIGRLAGTSLSRGEGHTDIRSGDRMDGEGTPDGAGVEGTSCLRPIRLRIFTPPGGKALPVVAVGPGCRLYRTSPFEGVPPDPFGLVRGDPDSWWLLEVPSGRRKGGVVLSVNGWSGKVCRYRGTALFCGMLLILVAFFSLGGKSFIAALCAGALLLIAGLVKAGGPGPFETEVLLGSMAFFLMVCGAWLAVRPWGGGASRA